MRIKDYYKTLKVVPTASANEIKKSYRKLAMEYHPDKHQGDKYKEALFREIQEAYEVLSDPQSREEYNYKRWFTRSIGKRYSEEAITAPAILAETKKLGEYVRGVNIYQVDHEVLSFHIRQIVSDRNIELLHQFDEQNTNRQIVEILLKISEHLPFRYIGPIEIQLVRLSVNDDQTIKRIYNYSKSRKKRNYWEKYMGLIVIIITLIICVLMYLYSR